MKTAALCFTTGLLAAPAPAAASELFGGIYVHDVDTPLSKSGVEGGADIHLGWRGARIGRTPLQLVASGRLDSEGNAATSLEFEPEQLSASLIGVEFHHAYVVLAAGRIVARSNATQLEIRP